jgi:hypothetical protein
MGEINENEIRSVVRRELIAIIEDAQSQVGLKKDPTGIGRKVLDGMVNLIRHREEEAQSQQQG